MPWKSPENWVAAEVMAPALSFALAFFRAIYKDEEPSWARRIVESVICGLITLSAGYGVDAADMAGEWKYAVAGAVGFLGTEYIQTVMHRFINKKVS